MCELKGNTSPACAQLCSCFFADLLLVNVLKNTLFCFLKTKGFFFFWKAASFLCLRVFCILFKPFFIFLGEKLYFGLFETCWMSYCQQQDLTWHAIATDGEYQSLLDPAKELDSAST